MGTRLSSCRAYSDPTSECFLLGFPGGLVVKKKKKKKKTLASTGDTASIPGSGRSPGVGNGNPLQYSCLEKSHGQSCLAGSSPWGCKESDTTERLNNKTVFISSNSSFVDVSYTGIKVREGDLVKTQLP